MAKKQEKEKQNPLEILQKPQFDELKEQIKNTDEEISELTKKLKELKKNKKELLSSVKKLYSDITLSNLVSDADVIKELLK